MSIKSKAVIYGLALALEGAVVFATTPPATAVFDTNALNQQMVDQQSQLNDHDARISKNEKDITDLAKTQGERITDVEGVLGQHTKAIQQLQAAAVAAPAPAPVEVVIPKTTKKIVGVDNSVPEGSMTISNEDTGDPLWCSYSYDNGSTFREFGYPKLGFKCKNIGDVVPL